MTTIYWSEQYFFRIAFASDEVWQKVIGNFLGGVVDPVNDLTDALQDDLERLGGQVRALQGWPSGVFKPNVRIGR